MGILDVLTMLGGLALFLYGMDTMGKGLEKQAGGRLQALLSKLTASPFRGFLLGVAVTAVIQSSSATTVMVVGFVNSGLMKLTQATGVIMGANVGTTVTAWILSLSGISGDNLLIQLLKPTSFTPVLAVLGIVLMMTGKDRRRDTGAILMGFAILMFGMTVMSNSVAPLKDVPAFTNLFIAFENPLLGLLAGAALTAIIQSSSASVGILQALSVTGAITYSSAIPIVLGQNIGTCVTALISAVGANKSAKRAAVVHLYFNVIGALVFLVLFLIFRPMLPFVDNVVTGVSIATIHTTFNIAATALMLPFTKLLERLAYLTIRDDKSKSDNTVLLDERLIHTPTLAVDRSRVLVNRMANASRGALLDAIGLTKNFDEKTAEKILAAEDEIDLYEDRLGTYLVHLSSHEMTLEDSREVSLLLHVIGDFERIGDHAVNLLNTAKEIREKSLVFSADAQKELTVLVAAIEEVTELADNAFSRNDVQAATLVEPLEQVVDLITKEIRRRHVERLQKGQCTIEMGFVLSDMLGNFERVADHSSNIAVAVIEMAQDSFDTHEYLNRLKSSGEKSFLSRYQSYLEKYALDK